MDLTGTSRAFLSLFHSWSGIPALPLPSQTLWGFPHLTGEYILLFYLP